MAEGQSQFELVFEGPADESAETLRRLKGIFIAELEFTIDQTISALQKFPITVKTSDREESLTKYYNLLQSAGAKVLLVKPASQTPEQKPEEKKEQKTEPAETAAETTSASTAEKTEEPSSSLGLDEGEIWHSELGQDRLVEAVKDEEIEPIEFELSLTDELKADEPDRIPATPPAPAKVFELDEAIDLNLALEEAAAGPAEAPPKIEVEAPKVEVQAPEVASPSILSDFTLQEEKKVSSPATAGDKVPEAFSRPELPHEPLNIEAALQPDTAVSTSATAAASPAQEFLLSSFSLEDTPIATPAAPESKPEPEWEPPALDLTLADPEPTPAAAPGINNSSSELSLSLDGDHQPPVADEKPGVSVTPAAPGPLVTVAPAIEPSMEAALPAEAKAPAASLEAGIQSAPAPGVTAIPEMPQEPSRTERKFLGLPTDIAVPIVIGAIVLGVVNWWIYMNAPEAPEVKIPEMIVAQPAAHPENAAKKAPPAAIGFVGAGAIDAMPTQIRLVSADKKVRTMRLSIAPPAPAELTPEQIVEKKLRDPWVKRIDIDDLRITNNPDGTFEGMGPARMVIDDVGGRRAVVQSQVKGRWDEDNKHATFHISMQPGDGALPAANSFSVSRKDLGIYLIALDGDFEAELIQEESKAKTKL